MKKSFCSHLFHIKYICILGLDGRFFFYSSHSTPSWSIRKFILNFDKKAQYDDWRKRKYYIFYVDVSLPAPNHSTTRNRTTCPNERNSSGKRKKKCERWIILSKPDWNATDRIILKWIWWAEQVKTDERIVYVTHNWLRFCCILSKEKI